MNKDILYTPMEVAEMLKITKSTVYEIIKRGDMAAHHIGKHIRISDGQLTDYLLKTRSDENTYRGEISIIDGETIAMIQEVGIHVSTALSDSVKISIRPEDVILSKGTFTSSARNMHKGKITAVSTKEGVSKVTLDIGIPLVALITEKSYQEMELAIGTELYAIFKTMAVKVF